MMLLRSRNYELDPVRSFNPDFNLAWIMFFGTKPPGIHPAGVFFTEAEREALAAGEVPASIDGGGPEDVEPYDPQVHNGKKLERM